jgi:hypothetical protein
MKKLISAFLSLSLVLPQSASATNAYFHVDGEKEYMEINKDGEIEVCEIPTEPEKCQDISVENPLKDLTPALEASKVDPVPSCDEKDLNFDDKPLTAKEVSELKNDLLKSCNKAFKKHKRTFAKQLLKDGRLFAALRVLSRKKKKIQDIKQKIMSEKISAEAESLEELNAKIKQEEDKILQKFQEHSPGSLDPDSKYYSENNKLCNGKYSLSANGIMKTPSHVYIKKNDIDCKIDLNVPNVEDIKLPEAKSVPPLDISDSFPDDCAYMVSDKFSEEDALKLLGDNVRANYCSNNQQIDQFDLEQGKKAFDYLDEIGKSFLEAAGEGLTPDFTLNVSRNLYPDEVRPLAQKRGEFVQKYIFNKIQKEAHLLGEDAPSWMVDFQEFAKVFKLKYPTYEGSSATGDYGPNPYATPDQFDAEKNKLKKTVDTKSSEIQKIIASIDDKKTGTIKQLNDIISKQEDERLKLKTKINELSAKMEKKTDLTKLNEELAIISNHNEELQKISYNIASNKKRLKDQSELLKYQKSRLTKTDSKTQVELLEEFYKNRPGNFDRNYKNDWDKKLFNNFKMVAIEGSFKGDDHFTPELDSDVTPRIQLALEKTINAQSFNCNFSMQDLKQRKFSYNNDYKFKYGWFKHIVINPLFITTKFLLGGELLLLTKKTRPNMCNMSKNGTAFDAYMNWGSRFYKKKEPLFELKKKDIPYNPNYEICAEDEPSK